MNNLPESPDQMGTAEDSNAKPSPPTDTEEYDRKESDAKAAQSTNQYQFSKKPPSTRSSQNSAMDKAAKDKKDAMANSHFEVRYNYNLETHCSKIDESFVDYLMDSERGNFIIYFDQSLYEPPQIILNLEKELERIE